jgi:hypothetical protein
MNRDVSVVGPLASTRESAWQRSIIGTLINEQDGATPGGRPPLLSRHLHPFRIKPWEIVAGDLGGESQAHRPLFGVGREQVLVEQVAQDPPRRALRAPGDARRLPAGELAAEQRLPQQVDRFRRQFAEARLPLHVTGHPPLQAIEVEQADHEADLVERRLKKEGAEVEQPLVRQLAAPVKIAATVLISASQRDKVGVTVAGKPSRHRPQTMPVDAGNML